ncbi:MAG: hypothetical protein ABIV28_06030 [Longimicrobiales bacterium]
MRAADFMQRALLSLMVVVLPVVSGCATVTEPVEAQHAILEIEYANFAWVPTWKGFVIDSTGAIYSYDLGGKQWTVKDPNHPTTAELQAKYATGRALVRTLAANETQSLFTLLRSAAHGTVSDPVNRCADAGVLSYSGYEGLDTPTTNKIVLRTEGDMIRENKSQAARELATKLAGLGLLIPISGCQPGN